MQAGTQEILLLISPIISAQRSLAVVAEGLYHDLRIPLSLGRKLRFVLSFQGPMAEVRVEPYRILGTHVF